MLLYNIKFVICGNLEDVLEDVFLNSAKFSFFLQCNVISVYWKQLELGDKGFVTN